MPNDAVVDAVIAVLRGDVDPVYVIVAGVTTRVHVMHGYMSVIHLVKGTLTRPNTNEWRSTHNNTYELGSATAEREGFFWFSEGEGDTRFRFVDDSDHIWVECGEKL